MGLTRLEADELAAMVTTLEMRERPPARPVPNGPFRLVRWHAPAADRYRTLFRRIGQRWLWYSRLLLEDAALNAITHHPAVEVHAAVDRSGIEIGLLELDFRAPPDCAIAYFGLVPELTGQRHGRWLMAQALALTWRKGIERVHVNTCTLDHPSALGFYRRSGFVPVARTVETFRDPRVLGVLPVDAAPQVPLIASRL